MAKSVETIESNCDSGEIDSVKPVIEREIDKVENVIESETESENNPSLIDSVSQMEIDFDNQPTLKNEPENESKPEKTVEILPLSQAIENGKKILFQLESDVAYTYEEYFANRGFGYTAKEIIINFEEYLQALFLIVATTNRDLGEEEMRFIWSVLSHADIFNGTNSIDETLEKALKTVKVLPHAVLISVAVDKFYDKTATAEMLNGVYDLYLIMCKLAGIPITKKEKLFAKIKEFAQAQGVKI